MPFQVGRRKSHRYEYIQHKGTVQVPCKVKIMVFIVHVLHGFNTDIRTV